LFDTLLKNINSILYILYFSKNIIYKLKKEKWGDVAIGLGLEEKAARKKINFKPLQEILRFCCQPQPKSPKAPPCTHNDFL